MKKLIRRILLKILTLIPDEGSKVSSDFLPDAVTSAACVPLTTEESLAELASLADAASQVEITPEPAVGAESDISPAGDSVAPVNSVSPTDTGFLAEPTASSDAAAQENITDAADASSLPESTPLFTVESPEEPLSHPNTASSAEDTPTPDASPSAEGPPTPDASPPSLITPLLLRLAFRNYLRGNGLEIGALHNSLDISGLPITSIRYVDRMQEDELANQYPELHGQPLVHVDIVDDGELLSTIPDSSVDFIIGNHFMEHTRNPIGTIENWLKKLTPQGILFLAIPDQRFTFDVCRPLTPLEHIVEDYQCDLSERLQRDHQHFWEWATYIYKIPEEISHRHAEYLEEINYSIHFHTFRLQSFLRVLKYMEDELYIQFELKACADALTGGNEFLVILSPKTAGTPGGIEDTDLVGGCEDERPDNQGQASDMPISPEESLLEEGCEQELSDISPPAPAIPDLGS